MLDNDFDGLLIDLDAEELNLYKNVSANAFFKYVYNSERFQGILKKLDNNSKLNDEEWMYVLGRLFLVTSRSCVEYEKNKINLKDKLVQLICRIGMFFTSDGSEWNNEFYKMFEYMNSFNKLKLISSDLYNCYLLVDDEKKEDVLKIYLEQHKDAYEFREYRSLFMNCYSTNNNKALECYSEGFIDECVGTVAGDERSNINMMNRAFESTKKLVKKYDECYNMNIDCEEE